jgi:hypothetical protein
VKASFPEKARRKLMLAWLCELGKDWWPEHVQQAKAGGIERVLL